jgi:hypothetical protein
MKLFPKSDIQKYESLAGEFDFDSLGDNERQEERCLKLRLTDEKGQQKQLQLLDFNSVDIRNMEAFIKYWRTGKWKD